MDTATALREFLEFIVCRLIDHPEEASIGHEVNADGDRHTYSVAVVQEDVGKIIGKNGNTIRAIRSLLDAAASRAETSVSLKVFGHEEEAGS